MEHHDSNRCTAAEMRTASRTARPSQWWTWGFGLLGFAIGCEVHVQRAIAGVPATPMLLAAAGALLGAAIGRRRSPAPPAGVRRHLRADLIRVSVVVLLVWAGLASVSFFAGLLRWLGVGPAFEEGARSDNGRFKVGLPDQYRERKVEERFRDRGAYVVCADGAIYVLRAACPQCGRTVNWLEGEHKFKCPHCGSGFYISGIRFEGPAPTALERCAIAISADGQLEVELTRRFKRELGEWANPDSHVRK